MGQVGLVAAVLVTWGCGGQPDSPALLDLVRVQHLASGSDLALNDDIVLTFSHLLDPTSVTAASVTLEDKETGEWAEGRWIPEGKVLRFRPGSPLDPELADGGFRPGAEYILRVGGHPSPARILSEDGRALPRSVVVRCPITDDSARPFRDASPDATRPVGVPLAESGFEPTRPLRIGERIIVACGEPLDPRTLNPQEFELVPDPVEPLSPSFGLMVPVPIRRMRLLSNSPEAASQAPGGALLSIEPMEGVIVPAMERTWRYSLQRRANASMPYLTDFSGGRPMLAASIYFGRADGEAPAPEGPTSFNFDFLNNRQHSPVLDPGSDGTARWNDSGRVEIRYPRAAGDGGERRQVLSGAFTEGDLHSTRLTVPAGEVLRLESDGLVVLRAQGRVDLLGDLVRRRGGDPRPMWGRPGQDGPPLDVPAESLTAWLERARAADEPWTVVIAGGDLVVRGRLEVDTPLLLVAGGWIRGAGQPLTAPGQLWLLGDGGGFDLRHHSDPTALTGVDPPLFIDPPVENRLKEALTFVAISAPAPKLVRPTDWRTSEVVAYEPPSIGGKRRGSARVQYLNASSLALTEEQVGQAIRHDEPMAAVADRGGGRVRLRIELVMHPSIGPWDPPFLDRVRLRWRSPSPR